MQVARINKTIRKALDNDTSLAGRIYTLFCEQSITTIFVLAAISITIATIAFAITGIF